MSSRKVSRIIRDEVPLLSQSSADSTSDGAAAIAVQIHYPKTKSRSTTTPSQKKSKPRLLRLFFTAKKEKIPTTTGKRQQQRTPPRPVRMDVRPLVPVSMSSLASRQAPAMEQSLMQETARATAPPLLEMPRNDTMKKPRPFPVPLRKRTNVDFAADDPPDEWTPHESNTRGIAMFDQQNTSVQRQDQPSMCEENKSDDNKAILDQQLILPDDWITAAQDSEHLADSDDSEHLDLDTDHEFGSEEFASRLANTTESLVEAHRDDIASSGPDQTPRSIGSQNGMTQRQRILALLNRPFGRAHLPVGVARRYVAEVSQAEWDADEHRWKYRVLLQNRNLHQSPPNQTPQSFTAAFTWRSLADFVWLEKALQREFFGGLLLPDLHIALGQPANSNVEGMPVEAERLKHWLNDVLNGIRGQGELILDHEAVDILRSGSMEKFLYHSGRTLDADDEDPESIIEHKSEGKIIMQQESFIQSLLNGRLPLMPLDFCVGPDPDLKSLKYSQPLGCGGCSSQALADTASYDAGESILADHTTVLSASSRRPSTVLAVHSDFVEAASDVACHYRKIALSTMDRLQTLKDEEELLGNNWKRFAICVSNLFAYEKDVENAKLCGKRIRNGDMPFRKIAKDKVDEALRRLSKHKSGRYVPALDTLQTMLAAYIADLSAARPAIDSFKAQITDISLGHDDEYLLDRSMTKSKPQLFAQSPPSIETRFVANLPEQKAGDTSFRCRNIERLIKEHERLLHRSLTELCRGIPIRTSRMVWKLWAMEAGECAFICKAAASLKSNVDLAKRESISRMIKRHLKEEKEDKEAALKLIQRMINLGDFCRKNGGDSSDVAPGTATDSEATAKSRKGQLALDMARERRGRWDSRLSLAIMEAVDVDDPHIRIEETTKELRLVRKYAIGLREHVRNCLDAVEQIQHSLSKTSRPLGDKCSMRDDKCIGRKRSEFVAELSKLSSAMLSDGKGPTKRIATVLSKAGIETSDLMGWHSFTSDELDGRTDHAAGSLCAVAEHVSNLRDVQTDWLLKSVRDLLLDYSNRVETIEGFVYMECVGIQLEKHFSQLRAEALAEFEKKTDLTAAMNVAIRKGSKKLVRELQAKLDTLGPYVSHTLIKETKDVHFESKSLKSELHTLAIRSLTRAREASTERVVALITIWADEEARSASAELKGLKQAMDVLVERMGNLSVEALVYRVAE